jgi:ubiquinone/menaquinone biosynthesis C-methylase UbiE
MHFTVEAQRMVAASLTLGDIAIDATAGNGFDTLFLAEHVGPTGVVYAIDIQPRAIETIREKLELKGWRERCRLQVGCHADLMSMLASEHVGLVSVAMFNLGYLPLGDKSIITTARSTLRALEQVHDVLRAGGVISILAYRGHSGGEEESRQVTDWIDSHATAYRISRWQDTENNLSPILWLLCRTAK